MISTTSRSAHPGLPTASEQPSRLLDIPRDVVPNIVQRLPGPDLLQLALLCKQTLNSKAGMLAAWASQELDEISLLHGEELWTRFLDLLANCGETMDPGRWANFLDKVASQNPEEARFLQLAALSPVRGKFNDQLGIKGRLDAEDASQEKMTAFWKLINGAPKNRWMGRAAAAALTGLWHHLGRGDKDAKPVSVYRWISFPKAFASLPLALQVKNLPCLEIDYDKGRQDAGDASLLGRAYEEVCLAHTSSLYFNVSSPSSRFSFGGKSLAYLACLGNMFRDAGPTHHLSRGWIRKSLTVSLSGSRGTGVGTWREQPPEFALLVFLALQWDRDKHSLRETFAKVLIDCGFVTVQECNDFMRHIETETRKFAHDNVRLWLSLNRDRQPETQDLSSCTVS